MDEKPVAPPRVGVTSGLPPREEAHVDDDTIGRLNFGELVSFYERVVDPLTLPIGLRALDLLGIATGDTLIDVGARIPAPEMITSYRSFTSGFSLTLAE